MNTLLKNALLILTITAISPSMTYGQHSDHSHDDGFEETKLYFSAQESENVFDHQLYDEQTGEVKESPLGSKKYPFAAVAEMESKMFTPANGKWAFKLGMIRSAFKQNQVLIENNLHRGFYTADNSFIYLDSDMTTMTSPEHAHFVLITDALAFHYETESVMDIKWNECNNRYFTGRYSILKKCSTRRFLDDTFTKFLEKNLLSCVNQGLKKAKKPQAVSVFVLHDGTAGDGRHRTTQSLHNVGLAIDIAEFTVKSRSNRNLKISYQKAVRSPRSWEIAFYKGFRLCWGKKTVQRDRNCKSRNRRYNISKGLNYQGSIGWEDSKHRNHIHISHPICSGSKRNSYYRI